MVVEYNDTRLHAALGYIEPKEAHFGDIELRRELRAARLNMGQLRREKNKAMAA